MSARSRVLLIQVNHNKKQQDSKFLIILKFLSVSEILLVSLYIQITIFRML
jgi:hypothetical protein